jgi:hypothetical protein
VNWRGFTHLAVDEISSIRSATFMRRHSNMAANQAPAIKVFYCYDHEDDKLREQLAKHLSPLRKIRYITAWLDRNIQAGTDWEHEIETHLNAASIILLLVSSDFINSDYHYGTEMRQAFEKHKARTARIIPIILRPVCWEETPIGILLQSQAFPTPMGKKPVTEWDNRDKAWVNVVQGIREVIQPLLPKQFLSPQETTILYSKEIIDPRIQPPAMPLSQETSLTPLSSLAPYGSFGRRDNSSPVPLGLGYDSTAGHHLPIKGIPVLPTLRPELAVNSDQEAIKSIHNGLNARYPYPEQKYRVVLPSQITPSLPSSPALYEPLDRKYNPSLVPLEPSPELAVSPVREISVSPALKPKSVVTPDLAHILNRRQEDPLAQFSAILPSQRPPSPPSIKIPADSVLSPGKIPQIKKITYDPTTDSGLISPIREISVSPTLKPKSVVTPDLEAIRSQEELKSIWTNKGISVSPNRLQFQETLPASSFSSAPYKSSGDWVGWIILIILVVVGLVLLHGVFHLI